MRILGIGVAVAVALAACSDAQTNTGLNPAGPPMIRQVFALELVMDGTITRQSTQLAFGSHPDISGDDDDGQITNAVALGNQRIRIVFDELIRGNALEEIACADGSFARVPIGTTPDDIEACAGPTDAIALTCCVPNPDVSTCRSNHPVCVDPAAGPIGVLDEDEDGAADDFRMIDGVVTLTCGGTLMDLDMTESFYQPSGNQQITAGPLGINSLGPAIILVPENGLRTSANCVIGFSDEITDKDGELICAPPNGDITQNCPAAGDVSLIEFQVEPLRVTGQDPSPDATNIPVLPTVLLQFNANIDPATVGAITLNNGGNVVSAEVRVSGSDGTLVTLIPDAALTPGATYEVKLAITLADTWGGTLPDETFNFSFTVASGVLAPDVSLPDAQVNDARVNDAT